MALEEAGELEEAARVFEHAGEHSQAALLRLEHARTLRSPDERLDVLREGCARNPGSTAEGRTLHLALAQALLDQTVSESNAARKRALELEAARALDEADEAARAGELFEGLGLLRRAARAYERGGEIARLELVLEVLERLDDAKAQQRESIRRVDEAIASGQRRYAQSMIDEHVRPTAPTSNLPVLAGALAAAPTPAPPAALIARAQQLSTKLITRDRVDLRWTGGRTTAVRMGPVLDVGRSPAADLTVPGARLSREHVQLRVDAAGHPTGRPALVAIDQGSRVGTFWQGDALPPGEPVPLDEPGELGLGMTAALDLVPVRGAADVVRGALVRRSGDDAWVLFLPAGGPLWLAPDIRVPARIFFDRGLVTFDLAGRVEATLHEHPLGPGANLEFMLGDRVCLVGAPLCLEVVQ